MACIGHFQRQRRRARLPHHTNGHVRITIVSLCLILILAVVASSIVSRILPQWLPGPFVQIGMGAMIGVATSWRVVLDPQLFFLLFVPPLLFLDGWRIPKDAFFKDRAAILGMALGLVILTVLGIGTFIHWMIPAMPRPTAFALAAVLSPTDPIAVGAVARRVRVPPRMMRILEGEALLNDASGLVCLRFAVAAAMTGSFSLGAAVESFAWNAIGGAAIGVAVCVGITWTRTSIDGWRGDDAGSSILSTLLTPIAAYLAGEAIGASGVLAAAAAGIAMTFAEASAGAPAVNRLQSQAVWDTLQFTLNGVVFLLLGEQMVEILIRSDQMTAHIGENNPWRLCGYIFSIGIALAGLRFAWVWLALHVTIFWRGGSVAADTSAPTRIIGAMSCAGARGAITMAGILTLPLTLSNGSHFPGRGLAIVLAAGVILTTMIIASVGLPLLLRGLQLPDDDNTLLENQARRWTAEAAMDAISLAQRNLAEGREDADAIAAIAGEIMTQYRSRITGIDRMGTLTDAHVLLDAERTMRRAAFMSERATLNELIHTRTISHTTATKLRGEIDLLDARVGR